MTHYSPKHLLYNVKYLAKPLLQRPIFVGRLAMNYIKLAVHPKRPPLRFADLAISYKCNMNCQHCSALPMTQPGVPSLTVEEYREVGRKLRDAGVLVINITGGEPLIHPHLLEIIECLEPNKLLLAVQTNAFSATREKLIALKQAGVSSLGISIDAPGSAEHDAFRNTPGAFERATEALAIAKELGFRVGISYCLTHHNLYSEDRQKMIALAERFSATLNYNLAVPIGHWCGKTEDLITPKDRIFLLKTLEEHPNTKTDFETTYFAKGCGAIKEKVYITPYGDVMPCPFIQVNFGNILRDDFETIRDRAFQYKYFQKYYPRCLAAEDHEFIGNTLCYDPNTECALPIPYTKAFKDRLAASNTVLGHIKTVDRPCPNCGCRESDTVAQGPDYEYRTCDNLFLVVQCRSCGLTYLNPMPAPEVLSATYPPSYKPFHFNRGNTGLIMKVRNLLDRRKARVFSRYVRNGGRCLDVGCGDGRYMKLLREALPGLRVEGVDFGETAVEQCRRDGLVVRLGAYESLAFPDASFDLINMNQVIEHFPEPQAVIEKAHRELAPGGILNIETPSLDGWDARLFRKKYWGGYHFPRHLVFFSEKTIRDFLQARGFEVLEVRYMPSPVFWVFTLHHWWEAQRGSGSRFITDASVACLGAATLLDQLQLLFTRRTSNMRLIARKVD